MGRPRQHHFIEPEQAEVAPVQEEAPMQGDIQETPVGDFTKFREVLETTDIKTNPADPRWREIDSGATSGMPHFVSNKPEGEGVLAHFKRTRAFANKRWKEVGKFVDFMTGVDLPFEPKYCRNRFN